VHFQKFLCIINQETKLHSFHSWKGQIIMSTNSHGLNDVKTSLSLVQIIVILYLYHINDLRMQEKIVPKEKKMLIRKSQHGII
jgi:hypothetical protein